MHVNTQPTRPEQRRPTSRKAVPGAPGTMATPNVFVADAASGALSAAPGALSRFPLALQQVLPRADCGQSGMHAPTVGAAEWARGAVNAAEFVPGAGSRYDAPKTVVMAMHLDPHLTVTALVEQLRELDWNPVNVIRVQEGSFMLVFAELHEGMSCTVALDNLVCMPGRKDDDPIRVAIGTLGKDGDPIRAAIWDSTDGKWHHGDRTLCHCEIVCDKNIVCNKLLGDFQ
jgi:hypothetical protein